MLPRADRYQKVRAAIREYYYTLTWAVLRGGCA
jgi:hypothetical protein